MEELMRWAYCQNLGGGNVEKFSRIVRGICRVNVYSG